MPLKELTKLMNDIAKNLDMPREEISQSLFFLAALYYDAKEGYINEEKYMQALDALILQGIPVSDFNYLNYLNPPKLGKITSFFQKLWQKLFG